MDILLLGNGFDLHYGLPTRYSDFLNIVKCVNENFSDKKPRSLGVIFRNESVKTDENLYESYKKYKKIYNNELFTKECYNSFIALKDNCWYKYLIRTNELYDNWIDFEKEINLVLNAFEEFFQENIANQEYYHYISSKIKSRHILSFFDFFYVQEEKSFIDEYGISHPNKYVVNDEYITDIPKGSGNNIVDLRKIVEYLHKELQVVSFSLNQYIDNFIDKPLEKIKKGTDIEKTNSFGYVDRIITFNYSNTYECLYGRDDKVIHLHGKTNDNIILGVNPNEFDELEKLDTSYIKFRKYYQRMLYRTDDEYYKIINENNDMNNSLYICGHSLDATDKDIIKQLFDFSDDICIVFHEDKNIGNYVENLVSVFGKEKVDEFRVSKNLKFLTYDELDELLRQKHFLKLEMAFNL